MATHKHISVDHPSSGRTTAAAWRAIQIVLAIGLLAALAITTAVTGAAPASAAISAPTGLTPATGTINANPVFAWSAVRGATGYEVQLAEDTGFNHLIVSQTLANRQFTPTEQLPMQKFFWRVRATDQNGVSSRWSATATLTRSRLAGPELLAPADAATLLPPTNPPLLRWKAVDGALRYHVFVSRNASFVDPREYTVQTTALLNPETQDAAPYYWRVVAEIRDGMLTSPSATRSYTVGPLGAITGATPDAESSTAPGPVVEQVVLSWHPLRGAVSYDIRVSTDISFESGYIVDQRQVVSTRFSPPHTYPGDDYYWQVRPRNAAGFAKDWNQVPIRRFTRTWSTQDDAATGTSGVPKLVYPADSLDPVLDDFYYQWTPARLATRYRLDLGTDQNFSPGTFVSCFTTQTTYVPSEFPSALTCLPSVGTTYFWRVKALDGPGNEIQGIYSTIKSFVYTKAAVTPISPVGNPTLTVPTLSWQPALDADRYQVTVKSVTSGVGFNNTYSTFATSFTVPSKLDPASYTWAVRSVDDNGRTSPVPIFGSSGSFTMSGAAPAATGAPLTPTAGPTTTTRFPSLTWQPYPGAHHYRLYVGTAGSTFVSQVGDTFAYPAATDTSDANMKAKNYRWLVAAYDQNDNVLGQGADGFFTIADLDLVAGHRVALDASGLQPGATPCVKPAVDPAAVCTGLTSTPVLDWDPVPGVGYYMVYLSRDPNFTNMVYGTYSDSGSIPTTTETRWLPAETLPDSQAGAAYYWFIRPCKSPGNCSPDPLRALHAFDKKSPVVQDPIVEASPAGEPASEASVGNDIVFSWRDYLATNQATVDPLTGEHPTQAAQSYRVQVARTEAFNDVIDDRVVDQRTYTAFDKLYPEGVLWWRVQAIDGSGRGLPWTPATSFTKDSPVPRPLSPIVTSDPATSTLTQTEPFTWEPTVFATRYDVEVYKNKDTSASPSNLVTVPNGYIGQSAGTIDRPFAAGMTYAWRVRRFDYSGNPGRWSGEPGNPSGWAFFKVTGKAPAQSAPASKALVSATTSLFRWSAVPTAYKYRFERRIAGSSSVTDSIDTVMPAWAFPNALQTGDFEWRVSTIDTSNQIVASSPWRRFRVDATAPTVLKVNPQSPFARTASINVRFQ